MDQNRTSNLKISAISFVLWMAYLLAMGASVTHVAYAFNTLQRLGDIWPGWAAAISIDCGLAALAYAIQQRRRLDAPTASTRWLWLGVLIFAGISAYANILHAVSVDPSDLFRAVVLSACLPLLVVYLGEIISSDDAARADAVERARLDALAAERQASERALAQSLADAERARADADRALADAERERLRLERLAERERAKAATQADADLRRSQTQSVAHASLGSQPATQTSDGATQAVAACDYCHEPMRNRYARAAHMRRCLARPATLGSQPATQTSDGATQAVADSVGGASGLRLLNALAPLDATPVGALAGSNGHTKEIGHV